MINTISTDYYINQLSSGLSSNNRYVFVNNIDGNLDMENNKWFLNLNFYLIMDAMLPMNLLTTDITLPFATIDDISLKYNPKADIPTDISFKKYCQVYQSSIAIDVGDSKFFQQSLTNYNMYLLFDFKCNSDVANKATFNNPDYSTADFMNEWALENKKIEFNYSNYTKVSNQSGWFDNSNSYYLSSNNNSYSKQSLIYYVMNDQCDELKKPIIHLLNIKVDEPASLISYRANFYYSVGNETKIHEYHYENKNLQYINNNLDINLDAITNYDDTTKEVSTNLIGTNGFYIPTRSSGYFEIEIQIGQNNNFHSYCFHKSFSFSGETYYDRNINIKEIFIDSINNNFKRMVF